MTPNEATEGARWIPELIDLLGAVLKSGRQRKEIMKFISGDGTVQFNLRGFP